MVDFYQNGARTQERRAPIFDLNQALTKEEEEEKPSGPAWLHSVPQKTFLHSHEHVQIEQLHPQQRAVDENHTSVSMEHRNQDQLVAPQPFFLRAAQQTVEKNRFLPRFEEYQFLQANPTLRALGTTPHYHATVVRKANSDSPSAVTQDFLVLHENQNQQRSGGFGTVWDQNQVESFHVIKSLSPVSPPAQRKPLSPISPEQKPVIEDLDVAVSQASPTHGTIVTRHHRGGDVPSRRHERDSSFSPKGFYKRRREHSQSTLGRSGRGGRSRSRTPPAHGHRHSPRSTHYSPRAGHSSRHRSSPVSYRPKRRSWLPPSNRDNGLGKPGRNLFIAGFSFGTTERDLERKFSRYGHVKDVRIARDRRSGESRGFAFLSLDRDENADAAIRVLDQTEWNGRIVLVEKAKDS